MKLHFLINNTITETYIRRTVECLCFHCIKLTSERFYTRYTKYNSAADIYIALKIFELDFLRVIRQELL